MSTRVEDARDRGRYEVTVDGELAGFAEYRRRDGSIEITHTEVDDAYEGQGLAGQLARAALDSARDRGLSVLPSCAYMADFIGKHPEYVDLVPEDRRSEFGL